jgi:hypothetical protein
LPDRPDEIALRVDAEQRGGYPETQALRDAARAIVDHRKIDGVLRRIALGLRAIGPDRDADDVEVVVAAELGDPRDRIADRGRDLVRRIEEVDDQALADARRDVEALVVERPTRERRQRLLRACRLPRPLAGCGGGLAR